MGRFGLDVGEDDNDDEDDEDIQNVEQRGRHWDHIARSWLLSVRRVGPDNVESQSNLR